jgi:hypothetical protein
MSRQLLNLEWQNGYLSGVPLGVTHLGDLSVVCMPGWEDYCIDSWDDGYQWPNSVHHSSIPDTPYYMSAIKCPSSSYRV